MTVTDDVGVKERQKELEEIVRQIGEIVGLAVVDAATKAGITKRIGFALMIYDFGAAGSMAYAANGQRADIIEALRELADKLEDN